MAKKITKRFLSCATAVLLVCANTVAFSAQTAEAESHVEILSIDKCAENIKKVYKTNYPEQANLIDETVDMLSNSDVFVEIFNDEGASAFQIIEDSLHDALDLETLIAPQMQTDDLYVSKYVFPNVQQINNTYCGPAATVMALIGGGASGYYYTNNESVTDGWQVKVAGKDYLNSNNGTNISNITNVLASSIPASNGYKYKTKAFTRNSYTRVFDLIVSSLVNDAVPVMLIDTGCVDYYSGYGSYLHYVVVESIDFNAECVTIVDPHHNDKYFGSHTMTFNEFNTMLYKISNTNTELWLSIYTRISSNDAYTYV